MGGGGFLTPKAIGNRIKAKGLQRLRWYCQMCQKQCRDQNGFKCHINSEAHHRQMAVFSQNAGKIMDDFSRQFEKGFMDILSRRHTTSRVAANVVYNEYIADRHHIHMNATVWTTLSAFVQYLGKNGKCKVDETDRGWYIQYISRDPEVMARQAARERKQKLALDDEERLQRDIERQARETRRLAKERQEQKKLQGLDEVNPVLENNVDGKIVIKTMSNPKVKGKKKRKLVVEQTKQEETAPVTDLPNPKKIKGADSWIRKNLIVKVVSKKVDEGKVFGQKGLVTKVRDGLVVVALLKEDRTVHAFAKQLETVVPGVGKNIMFVTGEHKGEIGVLDSINKEKYYATVKLPDGSIIPKVQYEDICKFVE